MDKLLTPNEAAELLGVSPITLRSWATKGLLPASVTAGGHRRYSYIALATFARERGMTLHGQVAVHRIMIIDDDESFGGMLANYLRLRLPGAEVQLANSGFIAGRLLTQFQPTIILLDLRMPGMSGEETCRMIKDSAPQVTPRIIAMTGQYTTATAQQALQAGADACIGKPIDIDALINHINVPLTSR